MAKQEQVTRRPHDADHAKKEEVDAAVEQAEKDAEAQARNKKKGEELVEDIDDLLDEIDSILEENAADFVAGYIQKGGQLARTAWENVKGGFRETVFKVRGQSPSLLPRIR